MNWFVCASLMALVVACSFYTADARMFRCRVPEFPWAKSTPACLWDTDPQIKVLFLWFQDRFLAMDPVVWDIINLFPNPNFQKINETITRILRAFCTDVDDVGGASEQYEFEDTVQPICHIVLFFSCAQTIVYSIELSTVAINLGAKILARGPWGFKGAPLDEVNNRDCYKMCKLFKDGATVSISGLRARPVYLGCTQKENNNGEHINQNSFVNQIDCEIYNPNYKPPSGGNSGSGGGGGAVVGWVLVGLVGLALIVIAVGAVAFWFFKIRTPTASPTASTLAESFAPQINLSKA